MQGAPLLPPAVTHLILTTTTVFESLIHLLTVNVHRTSLPLLSWQQPIRLQNLPPFVFTCQVERRQEQRHVVCCPSHETFTGRLRFSSIFIEGFKVERASLYTGLFLVPMKSVHSAVCGLYK